MTVARLGARLGARLQTVTDLSPEDVPQWNADRLQGIDVDVSGITSGDSLVYNGSDFVPGGGNRYRVVATATDYMVGNNVDAVLVDATTGDITITLPALGTDSRRVHVKKVDTTSHKVFVVGQGGSTVDGDPSGYLEFPMAYVQVVSFDAGWWILNC
jgi:hypothetical protein